MSDIKKGSKTSMGIYRNYPEDKTVTFNQKEKVDILNKYYGSKLKESKPFNKDWSGYVTDPSEPVINKQTIMEAIKRMKAQKRRRRNCKEMLRKTTRPRQPGQTIYVSTGRT